MAVELDSLKIGDLLLSNATNFVYRVTGLANYGHGNILVDVIRPATTGLPECWLSHDKLTCMQVITEFEFRVLQLGDAFSVS